MDINPVIFTSEKFGDPDLQLPLKKLCAREGADGDNDICGVAACFTVNDSGQIQQDVVQKVLLCSVGADEKPSWSIIPWEKTIEDRKISGDTALALFRIFCFMTAHLKADIHNVANDFTASAGDQDNHTIYYFALPGAGIIYDSDAVGLASTGLDPQSRITELAQILRIVTPVPASAHETLENHARALRLLPLAKYLSRDNLADIDFLDHFEDDELLADD